MFQEYRDRLKINGNNSKEALVNSTKRQVSNLLLNSPSRFDILMGSNLDAMTEYPTIVSDIETFYKRRFLFLPDTHTYLGDYIKHQDMYYLIVDKKFDDLYPQTIAEFCNETFEFVIELSKTEIGKYPNGKPIYQVINEKVTLPCVLSTKIYSTADNSAVPLPDGAMTIRLPYSTNANLIPKVNQVVVKRGNQYKVTTISYEKVMKTDSDTKEHGYLEVRLQREPLSGGS